MTTTQSTTEFVWAPSSDLAWGLVFLSESSDEDIRRLFRPRVHTGQTAAEAADAGQKMGPKLYRITRTSMLADDTTPAPEGLDYAFIYSTHEWHMRWSAINFEVPEQERFNRVSTFPDAAEAIQRARWATEEDRSKDEGIVFRAYLLTWAVHAMNKEHT
ncbi:MULTISPECIES: hypothetical protein [unclassified Streptomyces]|uniref:hypothetical protein n=1 Tax=unclassified Streptomyces TaxID=2593676 RepID=UPI00364013B5